MPGKATDISPGLRRRRNSVSFLPIKGNGLADGQSVVIVSAGGTYRWTGNIVSATGSGNHAVARVVQQKAVLRSDGKYEPEDVDAEEPLDASIRSDDVTITVDNQPVPVTKPVDLYGD